MENEKEIRIDEEYKEQQINVVPELLEQTIIIDNESIILEVKDAEKYKGEYVVTPLAFNSQELNTKDKVLEENIIVKEVPYFEVSNLEGTTVYIARGDE